MTRFSNQFNCSEVYDLARQILSETNLGRSLAMKNAWLYYKLYKGVVKFKYQKLDGTIREAIGTLNPSLVGSEISPNREGEQVYFDLEKNDFRCFKKALVL